MASNTSKRKKPRQKPVPPTHAVAKHNPWDEFIGIFKNDPDFAEVTKTIERNRRRKDSRKTQL